MSDAAPTPVEEPIRLGGMALQNGVLVHGPKSWACAIRGKDGQLKVASGLKELSGQKVKLPFLRGPARLAEALFLLKTLKQKLPEAKLPFERPEMLASMLAFSVVAKELKTNERLALKPLARELLAGVLGMAPAALSLRLGETAAYHGAEHIVIGSYEHGEKRAKEHERCGSHLVGPMLIANALAAAAVTKLPERMRPMGSLAGAVLAAGTATEVFGWMTRHPGNTVSKALAKPGHELQHNLGTREPSADQMAVADAALAACLRLERA